MATTLSNFFLSFFIQGSDLAIDCDWYLYGKIGCGGEGGLCKREAKIWEMSSEPWAISHEHWVITCEQWR